MLLVGAELSVGILAHEALKLRGIRDLDLREPALGRVFFWGFGVLAQEGGGNLEDFGDGKSGPQVETNWKLEAQ